MVWRCLLVVTVATKPQEQALPGFKVPKCLHVRFTGPTRFLTHAADVAGLAQARHHVDPAAHALLLTKLAGARPNTGLYISPHHYKGERRRAPLHTKKS